MHEAKGAAKSAAKPTRAAAKKAKKGTTNSKKAALSEASDASASSSSHGVSTAGEGSASGLVDPSEFGGAMIDPDTGKEVYYCAKCNKEYGSGNGRSIWKRHIAEKHGVPLSHQPHKSRWDKSSVISKAQSEEERRTRTLESKRRWAAKNREKKKALRVASQSDSQISVDALASPAPEEEQQQAPRQPSPQPLPVWAAPPHVMLTSQSAMAEPTTDKPELEYAVRPARDHQLGSAWEPSRPAPAYPRSYPPFEYHTGPQPSASSYPTKGQSPEAAAISLLGLRSSSPLHAAIEQPELLHSLPSSPPLSPSRRRNRAEPDAAAPHDDEEDDEFKSPVKYSPPMRHPQLGKRKRADSASLKHAAISKDPESDAESLPDLSFGAGDSSTSTMASGSSHHTLSTPHQESASSQYHQHMNMSSTTRSMTKARQQWLMDSYPMSSVFKSRRTNVQHQRGGSDFAFHLSSPMNASLSKSLGLVPDEGYYMPTPQEDYHAPASEAWSYQR